MILFITVGELYSNKNERIVNFFNLGGQHSLTNSLNSLLGYGCSFSRFKLSFCSVEFKDKSFIQYQTFLSKVVDV